MVAQCEAVRQQCLHFVFTYVALTVHYDDSKTAEAKASTMGAIFGEIGKLREPENAPNLPVWLRPIKAVYSLDATSSAQVGGWGSRQAPAEEDSALGADGAAEGPKGRGRASGASRRGRGSGGTPPPATAAPAKRRRKS